MKKVLVAMSGGVDSSVAAALLVRQGYFVVGGYMKNFSPESWTGIISKDCPWKKDLKDLKAVCQKLGIKFMALNFEREYRDKVIDYFFAEYARGLTPNPDVMCNKEIKFGLFLEKALELGFDYIATGHYARVNSPFSPSLIKEGVGGSSYELLKGLDPQKDQSYFLYTLTQDQLKHCLFPIGEYSKAEVRALARQWGLPNADKKDSQGICFVGKIKLAEFLKQRLPERVGEIVDGSGRVIGHHQGAWYYTIGQRHGLGVGGGKPYYVTKKDIINNVLTVTTENSPRPSLTKRGDGGEFLYSKTARVEHLNWISKIPDLPLTCKAKIRYQQEDQRCRIKKVSGGYQIDFDQQQFAVAAGQAIVFYDGDQVLGGGIIEAIPKTIKDLIQG